MNIRVQNRKAFTLVELMIVVVIIAILAGLTTLGTRVAIRKSKEAVTRLSLEQLSMALEKYKNDVGEYPPDFTDIDAVTRHMRLRWPRCEYANFFEELFQEQNEEAVARAVDNFGWDIRNCGPASALVFWLGGIPDSTGVNPAGFFLSPTDPFGILGGTSAQREEPRFSFPDSTIVRGAYKFGQYGDAYGLNEASQEDGPAFQPGKDDSKPVVYFTANAPAAGQAAATGMIDDSNESAYQLEYRAEVKFCRFKNLGEAVPYAKSVDADGFMTWYEPDRFQIIHPGHDGLFADEGAGRNGGGGHNVGVESADCPTNLRSTANPMTLTDADADNIVNFSEGGTLESLYKVNK